MDYTKRVKRKYLLNLLTSSLTLVPVLGGITCLAAGAAGIGVPVTLYAGGAGVFLGLGVLCQRLVVGSTQTRQRAMEEVEKEAREADRVARAAREGALDALDGRLINDRDPRTETALRDLRALVTAFEESHFGGSGNLFETFNILSLVDTIFKRCVATLEETLRLYDNAASAGSAAVRRRILKKRDALIGRVQESVHTLEETFEQLQGFSGLDEPNKEARLRELGTTLKQRIAAAKRADARIRSLRFGQLEEEAADP